MKNLILVALLSLLPFKVLSTEVTLNCDYIALGETYTDTFVFNKEKQTMKNLITKKENKVTVTSKEYTWTSQVDDELSAKFSIDRTTLKYENVNDFRGHIISYEGQCVIENPQF